MKNNFALGLLALLGPILIAGKVAAQPKPNPQTASIIQLIANPDKYDGKTVTVIGCLKFDGERIVLFLSCEDAAHHVTINGVWVNPSARVSEVLSKLDGRYIIIVGTFSEYRTNTLHLSVGELKDIRKALPF